MSSRLPYFDGDFTKPKENGPCISSIDPNNFGSVFTYQYCILAKSLAKLNSPRPFANGGIALGYRDPHGTGAFLVEGSVPTALDCGVVQYTHTYMTIPHTRIDEPELYAATYQFIDDPPTQIAEINLSVCARVTYTYFHAPPAQLKILQNGLANAFRYISIAGAIATIGEPPGDDDTWKLGEDENLTRVKGHIWEKRRIMIPVFSATLLGA